MAYIKEGLLSIRVGSHKDAVQGCMGRHKELTPGPHSRQSLLHVTKTPCSERCGAATDTKRTDLFRPTHT